MSQSAASGSEKMPTSPRNEPALIDFIIALREQGITLWVEEDRLKYSAAPGALTAELRAQISARKSELIAFLSQAQAAASPSNSLLSQLPPVNPIARPSGGSGDGQDASPLSSAQLRIWFFYRLQPDSPVYNVPLAFRLKGDLDAGLLARSLQEIERRHETLRTNFAPGPAGQPLQRINNSARIQLQIVDLSHLPVAERETAAHTLLTQQARLPFKLESEPLWRAMLVRLGPADQALMVNLHHIISDGWSEGILYRELSLLYRAYLNGEPSPLEALPVQYADYAAWQEQTMQGALLEQLLSFWKQELAGELPALQLPTDRARPPVQSYRGAIHTFYISPRLHEALASFNAREGVTTYMTLLAVFSTLLHRYSGQTELLIGTPTANRSRPEIEPLIGFFVNTLTIRSAIQEDSTFRQHLQQTRQKTLQALHYQDLPFDRLVDALRPERGMSASPLFQVMFVLQNATHGALDLPNIESTHWLIDPGAAKFDLSLSITELGASRLSSASAKPTAGLECSLEYSSDLFDPESMQRLAGHFQTLLESAISQPDQPLARLPILTEQEKRTIVETWNQTSRPYPQDRCVHQHFETTAARLPGKTAIFFGDPQSPGAWSFSELNQRANQIAHLLQAHGAGPETLVGICHERAPESIAAILGVLKAGGAYLPLDPAYPLDRLEFMLDDSQVRIVLTQEKFLDRLPLDQVQTICLDRDPALLARQSLQNPTNSTSLDNLAYCIYTSGSTGRPKGVLVTHRGIPNLVEVEMRELGVNEASRVLQFSSLSFDASVFEIFVTLVAGGSLVVASQQNLMPGPPLRDILRGFQVTNVTLPPSVLAVLQAHDYPALKTIVSAGEACTIELIERWAKGRRFFNAYGPTEFTVCASFHETNGLDWQPAAPTNESAGAPQNSAQQTRPELHATIGRPIANAQIYILDSALQPAPVRVAGEIYLGGAGLASGYLNRPELTAERFIPNPFRTALSEEFSPSERLYKTGDLACFLPDGKIEFLGRLDHQVKLRGFRIELDEIQHVINSHPAVNDSLVLLREDQPGQKRLVAYLTLTAQTGETAHPIESNQVTSQLPGYLKQRLPEYMAPSFFIVLDTFPLTPNGKIDRRALPAPENITASQRDLALPQSEIESAIAQAWQTALYPSSPLDQVRFNTADNFFELGGHSLLTIQVLDSLQLTYPDKVSLVDLFQYPTIQSLAQIIQARISPPVSNQIQPAAEQPAAPRLPVPPGKVRREQSVAVIGLSCRFPGAGNAQAFWENLCQGVESIRFFTSDELRASGVDAQVLDDPNYVPAKGYLEDAELFDAAFFSYSPAEAEIIDPQQRIFLEEAWKALENAGYAPGSSPLPAGVFAGASANGYLQHNLLPSLDLSEPATAYQATIGSEKDFMTTRVAYKLNLTGPTVTVQSACSTSLVAVHLACQALLNGECDLALAGGVSLSLPRQAGYLYQEGMILSPDGHCRAFDAAAKGTLPGEGVGVVILKRLQEALDDGDKVLAVINGSAINNDGAIKVGYTAPGVDGQAAVIVQAQAAAGISPDRITYIETHGTGTPIGDPIEIRALTQAFQHAALAFGLPQLRHGYCAIGSVKTNIGHLDAAAGIAGLIKTVLALQHSQLPPSLNFHSPNPQIDFSNSPFFVNTQLTPWQPPPGDLRRAGVSSFGIGGANAHVILEEAPQPVGPTAQVEEQAPALLVLSARSAAALDSASANLAVHLRQNPEQALDQVSYTLQTGRKAFKHRRAIVSSAPIQAAELLEALDASKVHSGSAPINTPGVAFLFPGQGAQYVNMGLGLYQNEPIFRQVVDYCCKILEPHLNLDLRSVLYPATASGDEQAYQLAAQRLQQTNYTQPALFVIEYALAQLWIAWGILPQAMVGHSIGEYTAACLADVFSLDHALALVAARGRLMQAQPAGVMLSIPLSEAALLPLLPAGVDLAAVNAPDLCVAAGPQPAIDALQALLSAKGLEAVRLHTSHAFHSAMMDPILAEFRSILEKVHFQPPRFGWISTVTGKWANPQEVVLPEYWLKNIRQPVRFADAAALLLEDRQRLLLEIGPGRTLTGLARRHPSAGKERPAIASLRHPQETAGDQETILAALGRLWIAGAEIDWNGYWHARQTPHEQAEENSASPEDAPLPRHPRRLPLPGYPFERKRFWITPDRQTQISPKSVAQRGSPKKKAPFKEWLYYPVWSRLAPPLPGPPESIPSKWLVFANPGDSGASIGETLARRLETAGRSVVTVLPGSSFEKLSDTRFQVNPAEPGQFSMLLEALAAQDFAPEEIVHLWSLATPSSETQTLATRQAAALQQQRLGFNSLLALAQALNHRPLRLTTISNNLQDVSGQEALEPAQAALLALLRVIPQEAPHLRTRSIDLDLGTASLSSRVLDLLEDALFAPEPHIAVALRGPHRWGLSYTNAPEQSKPGSSLRQSGVYLITGGLGGLGLLLAEHLARSYQARLALVSLSTLPAPAEQQAWLDSHALDDPTSKTLRKLSELEALGAQVLTRQADIADGEALQHTIQAIEARFGALNGVFHLAGITGEAALHDLTESINLAEQAQFRAKALAPLALADAFQEYPLDFVVLYSSISSLLGGLRMSAYAACNQVIDTFAQLMNRSSAFPWISISWDRWAPAGISQPSSAADANLFNLAITPPEGMQALEQILHHKNGGQIIVSTTGLQTRLEQWVELPPVHPAAPQELDIETPSVLRDSAAATSGDATEQILVRIWGEVLGIENPGLTDDFFELGGHSLLAVRLSTRVQQEFGQTLPISSLLEGGTIEAMARQLRQLSEEKTASARATSLVRLQFGENHSPIFLIHPVGGNILCYNELAKQLGAERSVYGIQSPGITGDTLPESIEELAEHYIDLVKEIQPRQPYLLAGWSMGGAVAFEMARKLRQNGEEGAIQLIMIDPWTPPENEASPQAPVALALANLWIEFYKDLAGKAFEKPEELLAQLKQLSPEKQATLMLGQARKDHLLTDEKSLSRLFGVFSANANALARYNPGAYQGHAIVIQAEQRESGARQPASAWQSLFSQPLEVIDLPGNHYTLLTTPGVGRLANYLKERLLQ